MAGNKQNNNSYSPLEGNNNEETKVVNSLNDITIPVSSSTTPVDPNTLTSDGYEFIQSQIIPSSDIEGAFYVDTSRIELFIYDSNKLQVYENYNFTDWRINNNTSDTSVPTPYVDEFGIAVTQSATSSIPTNEIELNPSNDAYTLGYDTGEVYCSYNFINYELSSSTTQTYYISEISGDRTEIRLKSNAISAADIKKGFDELNQKLDSSEYFDEFYLGLYNNVYVVAVNIAFESNVEKELDPSILIKLFEPLPSIYEVEQRLYVTTKVGESIAFKVDFTEDFTGFVDNATYIKGPNINIELQDLVNNSTTLKSYEDLTNTPSSKSLDSVLNVLNQKGITITPDYSYNTFDQFVNFSSAKERINNFVEKVSQIQSYQADIDTITTTTGSNPTVVQISSSLASLQTNITNLIANFDGYENYLYYNSSSFAYPKTGSQYPYTLLPTGSTEVLTWLGSDVENSQYYGGYILSASLYDEDNQNWLWYTIPSYITENSDNDNYITFANMVGQSFDEVWLYTKALSERYNTINDPDKGLPLGLAAEAIKGLGFETFGNNYNNQDNFIGLTGEDNGIYVPPTGSELITKYVAINNGDIINYWDLGYSWLNYVEQINEPGFPYAIDKVSKEIYKRLYHNMAYLTKKKGTISGLRQLINIWGIPNTILRINEFGGKNRDNTDDYDLWYNRYSYAYTPVANQYAASSSVKVPWMPLQRNLIADNKYIVPDGIAFRFKTTGHPSSSYGGSYYSQSLAVKKSNGTNNQEMDWGIGLFYEDQPSGSYSGSSFSDYYNYGKLRFYMSASQADGGVQISDDIELPFFDGGWWSVLLQRDVHASSSAQSTTYTLFAANKQVNGADGNQLGWSGSVSMSSYPQGFNSGYGGGAYDGATYDSTIAASASLNESWNRFGVSDLDGVYVGGYVSGSKVMTEVLNEGSKIFSGSFQEFRYYSNNIAKTVFNDFVMNPESVEGNNVTGSESSFDIVNFRAPLGNELEYTFTSSVSESFTTVISSSHPSITGSAPMVFTQSFINPANASLTSSYDFIGYEASSTYTYSKPNVETYFLDQPSIGVRNRVSAKIQVEDGDQYGTVLSKYRSIDQNYLISRSYTEDITNLEVGFSPQDEVNDDIIATYGYGVISDVLADPRFAYDSTEAYYPKLRQIAEEYFKKYTEGNVWDYLRLIKYFDNSLFKAIKSYVPARTSVTTGIIIKQHMLERNRRTPVKVNPNTIIAYTPETGSVVGGQSTATGMNSPISYRDLELTGSIDIATIDGSTGGVLNPYNVEATQSAVLSYNSQNALLNIPDQYISLLPQGGIQASAFNITLDNLGSGQNKVIRLAAPLKTRFKFSAGQLNYFPVDTGIVFAVSSSARGIIGTDTILSSSLTPAGTNFVTQYYEMLPQEDISFWIKGVNLVGDPAATGVQNLILTLNTTDDFQSSSPNTSSFQNSYVTQSYIVQNNTISGSVYEIHKSQDEFYNGEFSGSNIVVTTQSLLNNPYSPSQTLNTSYNIAVTTSTGRSGYVVSGMTGNTVPLTTYPSYSLYTKVYAYDAIVGGDQIDTDIDNFASQYTGVFDAVSSAGIFLRQASNDLRNFFIEAIIIPGNIRAWDNSNLSGLVNILFGFTDNTGGYNTPGNIPLPPVSASGFDGGLYAAIGAEPAYQYNNLGPYFKLDISGSDNSPTTNIIQPGATVSGGTPMEFAVNGLAGGMESNIIIPSLLGNESSIERTVVNDGIYKNWVIYKMPRASLSGQRPVRLNGIPDQNMSASFNHQTEVSMSIYIGNHNNNMDLVDYSGYSGGVANEFSDTGWLDQTAKSGVFPGSGSLFLQGLTWTGSFGDSGYYAPYGLVFNPISYDEFGNEIDNTNTLANKNVTFDFDIFKSQSGEPVLRDNYGFSGMEFVQSLNNVQNLLSNQFSFDGDYVGYQYDPINSRPLSGSTNNTSLIGMYTPSGSQQLQYVNFFPQQPPFAQFYNTSFNPLINNVTESVDNTYLQVVEYDNGPIPSNIEPIISSSALKAQIPDSFYTQKSSITSRYLGSKLQSANYNTFTPSGSQITYLNGELSGSIISGSEQELTTTIFCFTAGTQISMADNSIKNIEDIIAGESVLTYNETININEEGIVGNISSHEVESILTLTFNNGVVINTTEEHPFFVKEKGWTIASNLETSDVCQDINGNDVILTSTTTQNETHTVYNLLSVSNNHNFYANEILVHNKSIDENVLLGTSPVYGGDSVPGTMPSIGTKVGTVSSHPIYFAHFKTSKENSELYDTYTFRIDQLIECPLEDITGNSAPTSPKTYKLDGSGNNLTEVKSTFEVDRKALVAYNQGKVSKSGSVSINYTSLKVGESKIYQGALEYQTKITNQWQRNQYTLTQSFVSSSWSTLYGLDPQDIQGNTSTDPSASYYSSNLGGVLTIPSSSLFSLLTGSTDSSLYLMGGALVMSSSLGFSGSVSLGNQICFGGRGLAMVNSYNQYVSRSIYATSSANILTPGIPNAIKNTGNSPTEIQLKNKLTNSNNSYIYQDFLNTTDNNDNNVTSYENFQQPIIFEKGDEIRVDYNSNGLNARDGIDLTQIFTITDDGPNDEYENQQYPPNGKNSDSMLGMMLIFESTFATLQYVTSSAHIFDKVKVTPDPRNLEFPIPDGQIYSFTLRKRVNADDRVIIYQLPPTGSEGIKTLSPSGYLIPDDFTSQQKRNVQSIINNLSAKNVFRADEDNDTKRMPQE